MRSLGKKETHPDYWVRVPESLYICIIHMWFSENINITQTNLKNNSTTKESEIEYSNWIPDGLLHERRPTGLGKHLALELMAGGGHPPPRNKNVQCLQMLAQETYIHFPQRICFDPPSSSQLLWFTHKHVHLWPLTALSLCPFLVCANLYVFSFLFQLMFHFSRVSCIPPSSFSGSYSTHWHCLEALLTDS